MYCKQCGAHLPDDTQSCGVCGTLVEQAPLVEENQDIQPDQAAPSAERGAMPGDPFAHIPVPQRGAPTAQPPVGEPAAEPGSNQPPPRPAYQTAPRPEAYFAQVQTGQEPVSVGEWMLTMLLTMVPVVNIVMLCIWAFGKEAKTSKRNWALVQLVFVGVGIVLGTILVLVTMIGVFAWADSYTYY